MVSLLIGFAVVGALLAAYMASLQSGRHNDAMVQITEDATVALNVIRLQVAQAGYSTPRLGSGGLGLRTFPPVIGCAGANFGRNVDLPITALAQRSDACEGASASDAIAVAYEGSVLSDNKSSNGVLGGASGRQPLDCLGNSYPETRDPAGAYYLNDSKFYVTQGSLYCHGPGNAAGAALVEHVEALKIKYGFAEPGGQAAGQITYYDIAPPIGDPQWGQVVAIDLCIQVRSAEKVIDSAALPTLAPYVDCDNQPGSLSDGYLRRTFSTTVVLQNKLL